MTNILVPKLFGFAKNFRFCILSTSFDTLHVAYKKYKISELKTSENSDAFNILDETNLVFT